MFERFTNDARNAVVGAQALARERNDTEIGTEHVLLALARLDGPAAAALRAQGVAAADLDEHLGRVRRSRDPLDPEALRLLGIDLDAVRQATEWSFGEGALDAPAGRFRKPPKGHIPFHPQAKKALELSLRHALRLKQKHINDGHVLLGLVHDANFTATGVLLSAGADLDALRADVTRRITEAA